MENLSMCRICLATDVRLCSIASHLRDMFERISSVMFKREDRRPLVACFICHARLQNCYRLRTSCLRSEELLTEMMSSGLLKPQDMLSTNTFSVVSALHLSLGHPLQDSAECHIKEAVSEVISDAKLDHVYTEDIVMGARKEQSGLTDDYNQCSYVEDPLDNVKIELDDVLTDIVTEAQEEQCGLIEDNNQCSDLEELLVEEVDDVKTDAEYSINLEDETKTIDENRWELDVNNSSLQLADNIGPMIVKVVMERIDLNDISTEEEIDVISLNTHQPLPTPQTHDRSYSQTRVSSAQERQNLQRTVETAITRRSLRLGAKKRLVPPPNKANASRRRTRGSGRRGRRSYIDTDSEAETPEIERRSIHNDMERLRRSGLKNLFDELKEQIPATRNKKRVPKIVILKEAAVLCKKLSHDDIEREKLRKKQNQLVAKLKKLRATAHTKRFAL